MSLYAVKVDKTESVDAWIVATKERSKIKNLLKNPFNWKIRKRSCGGEWIVVFDVTILFPNFSIFGWMSALVIFFVWGWTPWLLPGLVVGCTGFFWSPVFFYLMTRKALRKAGYEGPIKRMWLKAVVKEVVLGVSRIAWIG